MDAARKAGKVGSRWACLGRKSATPSFQPKGVIGWNQSRGTFPVNLTFTSRWRVFFRCSNRLPMIKPSEFLPRDHRGLMKSGQSPGGILTRNEVGRDHRRSGSWCANSPSWPSTISCSQVRTSVGQARDAPPPRQSGAASLWEARRQEPRSSLPVQPEPCRRRPNSQIWPARTLNAARSPGAGLCFSAKERTAEFTAAQQRAPCRRMFPSGTKDNDDYTSIREPAPSMTRINGYLEGCPCQGRRVIEIKRRQATIFRNAAPTRLRLTSIVTIATRRHERDAKDEIFGPILPIKSYGETSDAIA